MSEGQNSDEEKPMNFAQQFAGELDIVVGPRDHPKVSTEATGSDSAGRDRSAPPADVFTRAHDNNLFGLACSGGGIRSATFNLGVIQGLAKLGLLHRIDYLSTVSGGGYIGSWLSSWVQRSHGDIHAVEACLNDPKAGCEPPSALPEPQQVRWLREFSNYLTPRLGALSTDTLTAVSTYLRNLILNQAVLVTFGAAIMVLPWLLVALLQIEIGGGEVVKHVLWVAAVVAALLLLIGSGLAGYETRRACIRKDTDDTQQNQHTTKNSPAATTTDQNVGLLQDDERNARKRYWILFICFVLAAIIAGIFITLKPDELDWVWGPLLGGAYGIGTTVGWWRGNDHSNNQPKWNGDRLGRLQPGALIAGVALGGLVWLWAETIQKFSSGILAHSSIMAVAIGPLAILGAILLTITLHLGLTGRRLREAGRELWSTHGAHQLRFGVIWLSLAGSALFGPLLILLANKWLTAVGGIAWVATTAAGVIAGSGKSTGGKNSKRSADLVARVAPYVFIVGILLALSYGIYRVLWTAWSDAGYSPGEVVCHDEPQPIFEFEFQRYGPDASGSLSKPEPPPSDCLKYYLIKSTEMLTIASSHSHIKASAGGSRLSAYPAQQEMKKFGILTLIMIGLLVVSLILSWRVDINIFGLHMFYRNRIERCYMGASNLKRRRPNPLTGLDPTDSPQLADLEQRPWHIVNTALNITAGRNLAWQERKAASFTFTPMHCGYELQGPDGRLFSCYQPTGKYLNGHGRQLSLGLPITISGAAASPNSGYHTSAATAFLMTVFNVRLGWWLQNPRYPAQWKKPGPNLPLMLLLQELFGMTTADSRYVYLSDGGHFENLGIYELVRRRCHFIIACDAGCDPEFGFEDLGNAIRKCHIDLGIPIDIDPRAIRPNATSGRSGFHCAVGRIRYDQVEPHAQAGYLLYVKASLTGDEPTDILQYSAEHPRFPHESTADQCYSESQFESYRKLGKHIADTVLAEAVKESVTRLARITPEGEQGEYKDRYQSDLEGVFTTLSETWYSPSAQVQTSFTQYGEAIEAIFTLMREDENLRFLDRQFYPEWWHLTDQGRSGEPVPPPEMLPTRPEEIRAGFYLCSSLLQLMENVYIDLNLEEQYAHPDNRGWMNLFRHWSWSGMLRITWAISASTYGARFQRFCRRRLDLTLGQVSCSAPKPCADLADIPGLNFIETGHIRKIRDCLPAPNNSLTVVQLVLQVINPFEPGCRPVFEFPFACALMDTSRNPGELVYYRVRDHLRDVGLGRKGLIVLYKDCEVRTIAKLEDTTIRCISAAIPEADYRSLRCLWNSVQAAFDEAAAHQGGIPDIDRSL